ncbi:unnamed protein product, partial [Meganyctiphanes norvegica]
MSTAPGEVAGLRPAGLPGNPRERSVQSNYSKIGESLRNNIPTEMQCSVFCGGKRCKYDTDDKWEKKDMAIDGIYSHWITDDILAMARPNTDIMQNKDIVGQFLKHNIKTVINLQLPGEHASCGSPLNESGFSYDPAAFMEQGIFFYNFGLKDYGEPTLQGILDMVKVMAFALTEGKVSVHCHAGLGRTGVLVACYLVYAVRVRASDAIRYVRMKRPNAVQTSGQISVVLEFERFVLPQSYVYCNKEFMKEKRNPQFTFTQSLTRQQTMLHGYEARTLKYIPKVVYVICERLLRLCGCGGTLAPPHVLSPLEISFAIGTPSFTSFFLCAQFDYEQRVSYSAPQSLGSPAMSASFKDIQGNAQGIRQSSEDDSGYPGEGEFSMGDVSVPNSAQFATRRMAQQDCITPDVPSCMSGAPERCIDSLLNDGIRDQKLQDNLCYQELASQSDLRKLAEQEEIKVVLPKSVFEALLVDHSIMDTDFKKGFKSYRIDLNVKQSAWDRLNTENNLHLLTALLFSWMEHLRFPILTVDSLQYIVLAASKPEVCLRKMDKEVRYTIEYLVRFVSRLQPLTRDEQELLLKRIISSVTQQAVPIRGTLLPAAERNYGRIGPNSLGVLHLIDILFAIDYLVYLESRAGSAGSVLSGSSSITSSAMDHYTARVTPPGQVVTPEPGSGEEE